MFAALSAFVGAEEEEKDEPIVANKPLVKRVTDLRSSKPENKQCVNCKAADPTHVCFEFQTFVCTTCSDIHMEFGHKTADIEHWEWAVEEVTALQRGGNKKAADAYLAHEHAASFEGEMRDFIRKAYVMKVWQNQKAIMRGARMKAAAAVQAAGPPVALASVPPGPLPPPTGETSPYAVVTPQLPLGGTRSECPPPPALAYLTVSGKQVQKLTVFPVFMVNDGEGGKYYTANPGEASTTAGSTASGDVETGATSGSDCGVQTPMSEATSPVATEQGESANVPRHEPTPQPRAPQHVAIPDLLDFEVVSSAPTEQAPLVLDAPAAAEVSSAAVPACYAVASPAPPCATAHMEQAPAWEATELVGPGTAQSAASVGSGVDTAAGDPADRLREAVLSGRTDAILGVFKECQSAAATKGGPPPFRSVADDRFSAFDELQPTARRMPAALPVEIPSTSTVVAGYAAPEPTPVAAASLPQPAAVEATPDAAPVVLASPPPSAAVHAAPDVAPLALTPLSAQITSQQLDTMDAAQLAQMHEMITRAVQQRTGAGLRPEAAAPATNEPAHWWELPRKDEHPVESAPEAFGDLLQQIHEKKTWAPDVQKPAGGAPKCTRDGKPVIEFGDLLG